jgi:hypothetical protein
VVGTVAGISSIEYWALVPGTLRQWAVRVSAPVPYHFNATGLGSVVFGAGTLSHLDQ